jgi:hypothetical protein
MFFRVMKAGDLHALMIWPPVVKRRIQGRMTVSVTLVCLLLCAPASARSGMADPDTSTMAPAKEKESPWLAVPLLTINPKLGFSLGALGGYLHYFDEKSKVSTFGVCAMYTSTHSYVASAFGKGIAHNLEYAGGKNGNNGIYMIMGYSY